jgi:hypothetical protein
VHDARHRRPAFVADRIGTLFGGCRQLGRARDVLRGDRVIGIGGVDQRRDILGQRDREIPGDTSPRPTKSSTRSVNQTASSRT